VSNLKIAFLSFLSLTAAFIATAAQSEPIRRESLLQFQYPEGRSTCSTVLPDQTRLELHGLFAYDDQLDNTVAHDLLVIGMKTESDFQYQSMIKVKFYDKVFWAKVTKIDDGYTYFALDREFLFFLWGTDASFEFENRNVAPFSESAYLTLTENVPGAMRQMTELLICWNENQEV
jgi:hypothetical protein